MKRVMMLMLSLAALTAFMAVGAGSASAETLPEFSPKTNGTSTSGAGKLNLTGAAIKCTAATGTITSETTKHGTLAIHFTGCTLGGEECHSLGDAANHILATVLFLLVPFLPLSPRTVGVLLSVTTAIHIECKFAATLVGIAVGNELLGGITPYKTKTKAFVLALNVNAGKQEFTEYDNDEGKMVTPKFEGSINEGTPKAATLEQAENKITAATETEIIN